MFKDYSHAIDDILDIPERRADNEFILETFSRAQDIYSCSFYQNHCSELYSLLKSIHNTYADSVSIETNTEAEEWEKKVWEVIRHAANDLLCTVVRIVVTENTNSITNGYRAMRDVSWRARAQSWLDHHKEDGTPI